MVVYYYIPKNEENDALNCGIKLSVKADKKVLIDGYIKPCISALLNPRDNPEKYKSDNYTCLRLELKSDYCFFADNSLYGSDETKKYYIRSIISPEKYVLGTYRAPECLITCTILPDNISLENKVIGYPILYYNSQELYINNLIENLKEKYNNFDEIILNIFFDNLTRNGQLKKIQNGKLTVFTSQNGEIYTVKKTGGQNELY